MTNERKKLVERVRKLLALAGSDNQHEAELAAQRASELLQEHQIAMSEVELRDTKTQEVKGEYYKIPGLKMKYVWAVRLAWAAAKLYDAEVLNVKSLHGTTVYFIGYPDDVEMAKETLNYLYGAWQRIVARDLATAKLSADRPFQPRDTMKFKLGHGQGFAAALLRRAVDLARERKKSVQESGSTGNALIVLKDQEVRKRVVSESSGKRRSNEQSGRGDGYRAGAEAGKNIALGGEITN